MEDAQEGDQERDGKTACPKMQRHYWVREAGEGVRWIEMFGGPNFRRPWLELEL